MKNATGVERNDRPTPPENLNNLSFWGVPEIDLNRYVLEITGEIGRPLRFTFDKLTAMNSLEKAERIYQCQDISGRLVEQRQNPLYRSQLL